MPEREMSLEEYLVSRLPKGHRARREYEGLRDEIADQDNAMLRRFDERAAESTDLYTYVKCLKADLRAARDQLSERRSPTPAPNTREVRALVRAAEDGRYYACGWCYLSEGHADPEYVKDAASAGLEDGECRESWVTAHVPLPEPPAEVAGRVDDGNN